MKGMEYLTVRETDTNLKEFTPEFCWFSKNENQHRQAAGKEGRGKDWRMKGIERKGNG